MSVIIPHYEDLANLGRCLTALRRQSYPRDSLEIVVADNGSPSGIAAVRKLIGTRADLVIVQERGAGPARNGGVAASSGDILAFIDSDCVPAPDWVAAGVKALDDFDFVGGQVTVSVADPKHMTPTEAFEKVFAFDFETYINRKGFTGSGNLYVPRTVFEAVGGFAASVSEDVDWSRRAVARGYRLGYAPKAIVSHPARRNWTELRRKWVRINRETFALEQRRPVARVRWLARTALLPVSALAHAPRVLASTRLSGPRERAGALAILFRCRLWRFADALKLVLTE